MALVTFTRVAEELTAEKWKKKKQPSDDSDEDDGLVPVSEDELEYLHSSLPVAARTRRKAALRAEVLIRQEH